MKLKIIDYISIFIYLVVIVLVSVSAYSGSGTAESVTIEAAGETYIYMLNTDRTIEVEGPLGITKIKILDSEVFVEDSPCRDKLCVQASPLNKSGEWNACLPNKVFIRIPDSTENELDSLSF
ncbi:MAG: NusG domain II-containing protein [Spirochaetales bacterium]|nr:NusG domain II-containing protein [Spirochaetales bacterium]